MNFIEHYDNALSSDICDRLIELYESSEDKHSQGKTNIGHKPEWKESTDIDIGGQFLDDELWGPVINDVIGVLGNCLKDYKKKYTRYDAEPNFGGLDAIDAWGLEENFNFQKFKPGQGYKVWHCETSNIKSSERVLVWMIYLNDVYDKGGTEFLLQDMVMEARKGRLVLWPPYWTHFHKSQVSPSETKYILTGWLDFKPCLH